MPFFDVTELLQQLLLKWMNKKSLSAVICLNNVEHSFNLIYDCGRYHYSWMH